MDFTAAMARIQAITNTRTQVELAAVLDIRQSSISDAKRRQSIPDSWLQALIWKFDASPRFILGESDRPYICEDTTRELAAPCQPTANLPALPAPTVSDILDAAKALVGPGYEFVMVPAGVRVSVEMAEEPKTYTMGDLVFSGPHELPGAITRVA